MKILIVTSGFFPGKKCGGPPVSIDNFCSLMDTEDCYIIARDHDLGEKKRYENIEEGWNDRGNCKVIYLSDEKYRMTSFEKIICEVKPDIIYLQSLFQKCVFPCLWLAKKLDIKVLLAPRGELCAGAFRKKYKKLPYILILRWMGFLKDIYFQSTSEEETQAIKKHLISNNEVQIVGKSSMTDKIFFLSNIPSISANDLESIEKRVGVGKFIFLSRIHPKKNLLYAIKCLKNIQGQLDFDIYGPIEDEKYWKICQNEIQFLPDNIRVNYCGLVNHDEVHQIFSQYDAFLFPTISENYGHVIIEALSVGCPVIISNRTPWSDIEKYGAGYVCELEEKCEFENAIQSIINNSSSTIRESARCYAKEKMNLESLQEEYFKVFKKITQQ